MGLRDRLLAALSAVSHFYANRDAIPLSSVCCKIRERKFQLCGSVCA